MAPSTDNGNRAAGRGINVSEKIFRDWRKARNLLRSMKGTKKADRGKKARWPQLESLRTWILEQRAESQGLSTVQVCLKAGTIVKDMNFVLVFSFYETQPPIHQGPNNNVPKTAG